jgi:hypothetical protein
LAVGDTDLASAIEDDAPQSSRPSLLLSASALVGGIVEGACALLVASSSAKVFVGLGAVAAAMKSSRLHADIVRIPVMVVSAAASVFILVVLWNAWRARNLSTAHWRKRRLSFREKLSFCVTLLASVLTLGLVIGEAIEHPIFHLR